MTNAIRSIVISCVFVFVASTSAFADSQHIVENTFNGYNVTGILICESSNGSEVKAEIEDFIRNSSISTKGNNVKSFNNEVFAIAGASRCLVYEGILDIYNPNPFSGSNNAEDDEFDETSNDDIIVSDVELEKPPYSLSEDEPEDF